MTETPTHTPLPKKPLYFCTRCKSMVREVDDYGEFIAGKCRCDRSPSPWVAIDLHWEGLAEKFRPGGTALPKSITGVRDLLPHAKNVSVDVVQHLMVWLEAAYERNAEALTAWNTRADSHHRLIEALEKARKIIADIDDYMKRPSRGDWGEECACCMGELLDDDRDAIAKIDAALKEAGRG